VFRRAVPGVAAKVFENGVDFEYFRPAVEVPDGLADRKFLVFAGAMDYYPNAEGAVWFGSEVFPELRRADPGLEFFVVGRNPAANVRRLGGREGITVTGPVPDVRPYLQASRAAVTPLRIARGIQNKVLEALVMGKRVFATDAVCATFGGALPEGVTGCGSEASGFIAAISGAGLDTAAADERIRGAACGRFRWDSGVGLISEELSRATAGATA
jgi:glycosyltransferase involved in cell wall biosynthesis